ncbi:hypothetical protein [Burkholderia gladioli]|uniref:hypothetical protein n=1 Tax=Burkholderia gladioli TaxID=28095 RepID=UPI00163F0943|nr:hypothetical protein [Burkholderia gladioli]
MSDMTRCSLTEFGPYYFDDQARNDPDATRGGYFLAEGRAFHWYHQSKRAKLGASWADVGAQALAEASTWCGREEARERARQYMAEVAAQRACGEPVEVLA